jgi:N-acetylglucosamine kinase-like BadF-type ATPase
MPLYAGIDGGQSSTTAVIADERGRILARGRGGPADEVAQGADSTRLRDALSSALGDAMREGQLPRDARFAAVVAGISGYEGTVYGRAPELPTDSLTLMHDTPIAHAGALGGGAGVVVIAGTGSVAYAADERGESALTGGWGYLFGDEGSAFALARSVVADAMRACDAGEESPLAPVALSFFNLPSLRKISRAFYTGGITRSKFAEFASAIVQHAESGDPFASRYVEDAAHALVRIAMQAADRARLDAPRVAFTGGMLQSALMRERIAHWMRELLPRARHIAPLHDAAAGALLLAYKAGGVTPPTLSG